MGNSLEFNNKKQVSRRRKFSTFYLVAGEKVTFCVLEVLSLFLIFYIPSCSTAKPCYKRGRRKEVGFRRPNVFGDFIPEPLIYLDVNLQLFLENRLKTCKFSVLF